MRLSLLTAGATSALLMFQVPVMAQTASDMNKTNSGAAMEQPANAHSSLRAQLQTMLQNQGFSDVRVIPSSFLVRAKDKDGNPVVMSVSPDSITEVAEVGSQRSDTDANANANGTRGNGSMTSSSSSGAQFVAIPHGDELSSNVVGLDVYNNDNKDIGQIKDVAWNEQGRAQAYILSVGGFLGLGTHYVAVKPQDVKVSYNESDKKWHATMNATADQLKAAPEFKYEGRWNASKS